SRSLSRRRRAASTLSSSPVQRPGLAGASHGKWKLRGQKTRWRRPAMPASEVGHMLRLPHGDLPLPAFLPDATLGVVRAVDAGDLEACDVPALVMNTFHLMQRPGSSTIKALGGLHAMSGWQRPIVTDSGGFQAYSLVHQ